MVIDTGSGKNFIGDGLSTRLFNSKTKLRPTNKKFYAYGQKKNLYPV